MKGLGFGLGRVGKRNKKYKFICTMPYESEILFHEVVNVVPGIYVRVAGTYAVRVCRWSKNIYFFIITSWFKHVTPISSATNAACSTTSNV